MLIQNTQRQSTCDVQRPDYAAQLLSGTDTAEHAGSRSLGEQVGRECERDRQ
jgi:hypothetical protein